MGQKVKQCVIIGSSPEDGDFAEIDREQSFVICADGGLDTASRHGITPDLLIGDFDSVQGALPDGVETIRLKTEKDDTDLMAAARVALQRDYRDFILLGAMGGRPDHSFANFCLLKYLADQGCRAVLLGDACRIYVKNAGVTKLNARCGKTVSVFPFGAPYCTVSYRGLKYPLTEHRLTPDYALGVSNIIIEDEAEITVHNGSALIIILI